MTYTDAVEVIVRRHTHPDALVAEAADVILKTDAHHGWTRQLARYALIKIQKKSLALGASEAKK
jgi:hypothetical protein